MYMHRSDVDLLILSLEQNTVTLHSRAFSTIPVSCSVRFFITCETEPYHSVADDQTSFELKIVDSSIKKHVSNIINPRRAYAVRVTVVGSVCLCVCLSV